MSLSLAWVTPFSQGSDISSFSRSLLQEFCSRADTFDATVTVFVNENGPRFWSPAPAVFLRERHIDRELLLGFDFVVFNVGNNEANHSHINLLALDVPGVVIMHDLVMQHTVAGRLHLGDHGATKRADVYSLLMGSYYGMRGLEAVDESRLCHRDVDPSEPLWDTPRVTALPLIEPFIDTAAAVVAHSTFGQMAVHPVESTPLLRLQLPWDQKPTLSERELEDWAKNTSLKTTVDFVYFGHLSRSKCLEQVISAFRDSSLLRAAARLTIVGRPDNQIYVAELQHLVEESALQYHVTFALGVSDEALHDWKLQADVFVNLRHPNTESASSSLSEQLNAGKPVIAYPTGVFGEIAQEAFILVERASGIAGLISAMEAALLDPSARIRIGAAGRRFVRQIDRKEYVSRLWQFLLTHRDLLRARKLCAAGRRSLPEITPETVGAEWLTKLTYARRLFAGLESGPLELEALPFADWDDDALALFITLAVFGQRAGSALETTLRAELPAISRSEAYERVAQANLLFKVSQIEVLSQTIEDQIELPMLCPGAWRLLAALDAWALVQCCYVGLLGRLAEPGAIAVHLTSPYGNTLAGLLRAFLNGAEFLGRRSPANEVEELRRWLDATALPLPAFPLLSVGQTVSFTTADPDCQAYLASRWDRPELDGTWSRASSAAILWGIVSPQPDLTLTITGRLIGPLNSTGILRLRLNGIEVFRASVPNLNCQTISLLLKSSPDETPKPYSLEFDCGPTVTPRELGLGDDNRELGFNLISIALSEASAAEVAIEDKRQTQIELAAAALALFDQHVAETSANAIDADFNAAYYSKHRDRFAQTFLHIPPSPPNGRVLEIGATSVFQVALHSVFHYSDVIAIESSTLIEHKRYRKPIEVAGIKAANLTVSIDIENDLFPFADESFDLVLCCEVIEHLDVDPMFMLCEINRICKPGGTLLLTTPNSCSARNFWKIANGTRPHFYMQYIRDRTPYRHNFEYDVHVIKGVVEAAGFTIESLSTHDVFEPPLTEALSFLERNGLSAVSRGDDIFLVARRTGPVTDRWPELLYV